MLANVGKTVESAGVRNLFDSQAGGAREVRSQRPAGRDARYGVVCMRNIPGSRIIALQEVAGVN